jgi:hypothetical protein
MEIVGCLRPMSGNHASDASAQDRHDDEVGACPFFPSGDAVGVEPAREAGCVTEGAGVIESGAASTSSEETVEVSKPTSKKMLPNNQE